MRTRVVVICLHRFLFLSPSHSLTHNSPIHTLSLSLSHAPTHSRTLPGTCCLDRLPSWRSLQFFRKTSYWTVSKIFLFCFLIYVYIAVHINTHRVRTQSTYTHRTYTHSTYTQSTYTEYVHTHSTYTQSTYAQYVRTERTQYLSMSVSTSNRSVLTQF